MAHTRRNIILGLIGASVLGGLAYVSYRPEPVAVDLHTVERGDLVVTVDVDGTTRVKELFEISAPITGVALRSPVEVGDSVVAGETVVARVEPAEPSLLDARSRLQAEASVREAEAALVVAETELARANEEQAYAKTQYDRASTLVDRGVSSITRLEDNFQRLSIANAAVAAATARIDQAEGTLERARAALTAPEDAAEINAACCTALVSPADGVVLSVDQISERPVLSGARLLSVGDPSELEIVADLLSSDAVRLPVDARASVERWGGDPLEARLVRIEPMARTKISALGIDEQRVDAVFELTSPAKDRAGLGHGFAVFLRVIEFEEPDTLLLPLSAAFRTENGWQVFRADGTTVQKVPVTLGRRNGRFASVTSGLEAGDQVVVHPSDQLSDGALIVERTAF